MEQICRENKVMRPEREKQDW
uniref:Uncharacterized protein n=1 Tax=Anguilla anguilla TaxID=7936 RepID=A0A0E9U5F3_ANGAN